MADRVSDRDDECPACGCDAAYGCDCDDDGEAMEAGVERLEEGEPGRERTQRGSIAVDTLAAIAGIALMLFAFCTSSQRIAFRSGWLNGVRADGWYELRRQGGIDSGDPPGVLRSKLYCTNGLAPVATDYRTVACARVQR